MYLKLWVKLRCSPQYTRIVPKWYLADQLAGTVFFFHTRARGRDAQKRFRFRREQSWVDSALLKNGGESVFKIIGKKRNLPGTSGRAIFGTQTFGSQTPAAPPLLMPPVYQRKSTKGSTYTAARPPTRTAPPTPPTKGTTAGKAEIYNREHLVGPFLVHKLLGPRPPAPSSLLPITPCSGVLCGDIHQQTKFIITAGFESQALVWMVKSPESEPFILVDKDRPHVHQIIGVHACKHTPQVRLGRRACSCRGLRGG